MKNIFYKWLLLFIVLAFCLTFGLSWYLHQKDAKKNALQLLELNLTDAVDRIRRSENSLQTITEMSETAAIAKTRAFAQLIQQDPTILQDVEKLELIRKKLDVDELHVSDKTGKLIASLRHNNDHGKNDYLGFNLADERQSEVFMKAVTDPAFELVQEPQYNGAEGRLFQYTGVARLDEPGVVQIGYIPDRIQKARQIADVKNIESEIRIGINGKLSIVENTEYPADYKKVLDTREGLCQSIVCGKYLLTAVLPWEEVYTKDDTVIAVLFLGNIIVFSLIFILIACLLQKVVIKEISAVTNSLDEISNGNFDKTLETTKTSEMRALAEQINKTINTLKKDTHSGRAESENEIFSILKNSLCPANIPESDKYKFTAEMVTATEISNNSCDIFQVDKEHIAMFFAAAAEAGIPQGLYMMKVKNLLKKVLLKNSPETAMQIINEKLFQHEENNIPLKALLCIINLRSGILWVVNAGYANPVLKQKNSNALFISCPISPSLGTSSDTTFIHTSLLLSAGDKLYFYPDDTINLSNAQGEKYGRERLKNAILSSGNNAQDMINFIRKDMTDFTGEASPQADLAIAVLEYTPTNK